MIDPMRRWRHVAEKPDYAGLATFALWDQARTAFLAAAITLEQNYRFTKLFHTRIYDVRQHALRDIALREAITEGAASWASLPAATCPAGSSTMLCISARAAYAATEADVLPVEAQHTQEKPSAFAMLMAAEIPVSLKEPLGFMPWCLANRFGSLSNRAAFFSWIKGVLPSPMVTMFPRSTCGSSSLKRHTPLAFSGSGDPRRSCHISLSRNPKPASASAHSGYTTSTSSEHCVQRNIRSAVSCALPQCTQRSTCAATDE